MFNLREHGDSLEKDNIEFIETYVFNYKILWEAVFGNDGSNQLPGNKISDEFDNIRTESSQLSYTVLESLIRLKYIKEEIYIISELKDYYKAMDDFILFFAHYGRIVDCFRKWPKKMTIHYDNDLTTLYGIRNQVLHGKKLPFVITKNLLNLPDIKGLNNGDGEFQIKWDTSLKWNEIKNSEFKLAQDIYEDAFKKIIELLNKIFSTVLSYFKSKYPEEIKRLKSKNMSIKNPSDIKFCISSSFDSSNC